MLASFANIRKPHGKVICCDPIAYGHQTSEAGMIFHDLLLPRVHPYCRGLPPSVVSWKGDAKEEYFGPWLSDNVFILSSHVIGGVAGYRIPDQKSWPCQNFEGLHWSFISAFRYDIEKFNATLNLDHLFLLPESFMRICLCL